jgi:hypothetical protein
VGTNVASTSIDAIEIPSPTSSVGLRAPTDNANYSADNSPIGFMRIRLGKCTKSFTKK